MEEEIAKRKMEQRKRKLERMREVWRCQKLGLPPPPDRRFGIKTKPIPDLPEGHCSTLWITVIRIEASQGQIYIYLTLLRPTPPSWLVPHSFPEAALIPFRGRFLFIPLSIMWILTQVFLFSLSGSTQRSTLLENNNLLRFAFQIVKFASPNILSDLFSTLDVPLEMITKALAAPLLSLDCPAWDDLNSGGESIWEKLQELFPRPRRVDLDFEACRMEGQGERWELEVEGKETIVTAGRRGGYPFLSPNKLKSFPNHLP